MVSNQLSALGDTGPEAVARMIKLEVRQSQSVPPAPSVLPSPVPSAGVRLPAAPPGQAPRAIVFAVLVGPGAATTVLAKDPDWFSSLEKEKNLAERLMNGGQFSLAGAQPKTALLLQNGRWGIPSGRLPTTHILKPPTGQFDGHAENEHICLLLTRSLGLPTAQSKVMRFGEEIAIVTEIPGTTRDILTERIDINGLDITLLDTAGLREAADAIEAEGF